MTAFAINSGGVEYYDQKTGGSVNATLDTYTVSDGSTLVVRTDTYACPNHSSAFGSLDNVAFSGIGGDVIIDPTYVRYVAYTGGSGNSPEFGAAISQGGVSGVFLGVWANWQSEPIVPAAAIPARGFIKIGGITGGAFSAGALTGIAATCSGADLQGWIEVRSGETATLTVPRVGEFSSVLAWFYLDNTTGVAGQVIPCPTTGSSSAVFAGAFIETAPGSNVFEKFCGVGSQPALATTPTDARAKFVWHTTSGLRLGSDGTNTVGYLPPSGCRVRIPAAILTNCTRSAGKGSGPRVVPNATVATRSEFVTTSGGAIDLNGVVCQWYCNFTSAFSAQIKDSIINDTIALVKVNQRANVNNVIVSCTGTLAATAISVGACLDGADIVDCLAARYSLASSGLRVISINTTVGVVVERCTAVSLTARATQATSSIGVQQATDTSLVDCITIGARIDITTCRNTLVDGQLHADGLTATITGSNAAHAIQVNTGSVDTTIIGGGAIPGVTTSQPYYAWLDIVSSDETRFFNFGTFASPYDCGSTTGSLFSCGAASFCNGIYVKRGYIVNSRTKLWSIDNSQTNFQIYDVFGDYADAMSFNAINMHIRNVGCTNPTTGVAAIYGSHWVTRFTSATAGIFELACNEASEATASQYVVTSGSPKFNGSGSVLMTIVGQQIIWEMPFFALGHTALANTALSLVGTNTGNLSYEFQYDLGSGYNGTWLTANATNFNGVGAINPATGIKIKLRVTCVTANASNLLTNLRITTVTTSTAQSTNLSPLSYAPISVSGLTTGSRVKFSKVSDGTILYSAQESSGVVNFDTNEYVGAVSIEARNASSAPYYLPWVTQVVTVDGQTTSAIALQQLD